MVHAKFQDHGTSGVQKKIFKDFGHIDMGMVATLVM